MTSNAKLFRCICLSLLVAGIIATGTAPVEAMKLPITRHLDVSAAMGGATSGAEIRALAYDGSHLWLVRPAGDSIAQVDSVSGVLVAVHPLVGVGPVTPAGMTFGAGDLWLLDAASFQLLQVDRTGRVLGATSLTSLPGSPVSVDLRDSPAGGAILTVGYRSATGDEGLQRYLLGPTGPVFDGLEPMKLGGTRGRATMAVDGFPYTWVSAPREDGGNRQGDEPDEEDTSTNVVSTETAPDRSIPRGGEDVDSTHLLALVDPVGGALLFELFPSGAAVPDMAAGADGLLFYPDPGSEPLQVLAGQFVPDFDVQYGACACRDVDFHQEKTFDNVVDQVKFNFANPWDESLCFGPTCDDLEKEATGGYLAQKVKSVLNAGPFPTFNQTVIHTVGTGSISRHSRSQLAGDNVTGFQDPRYEIRVETCEAGYMIMPHAVGSLDDVPAEILDLYTYDGNNDGFGDDNPATNLDDFYTLDSPEVHTHLLASGALGEPNLFYKVRRILHYVKRRHVYSGADGGWASPQDKLESAYASCSPSSFMVVALARRAGIPARLVGTTKQRGKLPAITSVATDTSFHRWAQVYFPNYGWIRVDATPRGGGFTGMEDVNGDDEYDECDLCTHPATCFLTYELTFEECGLELGFENPNDVDDNGVVNGDDVDMFADAAYTEAELDKNSFVGVGTDDLITIVTPGVINSTSDLLKRDYIAYYNADGDTTGDRQRRADWRRCHDIDNVFADGNGVSWDPSDSFTSGDEVRVDLYRLEGAAGAQEYVHVAKLAENVPALAGLHLLDLSGFGGLGDHTVVVAHQTRLSADELTSFAATDWTTFGQSQAIQLSGPPAVPSGGAGQAMTVAKLDPNGDALSIAWDTSCIGAVDHQILFGGGSQLPSATGGAFDLGGAECAIGTASPFAWSNSPSTSSDPTGLIWWLIVATDGAGTEGSWGRDSASDERTGPLPGGASGQCAVLDKDLGNTCGQ